MGTDFNGRLFGKLRRLRLKYLSVYSTFLGRWNLRIRNITFGKDLVFYGKAYFYRAPFSSITIGDHAEFRSDNTSNQIGVSRRCIISTLQKDAQIIIGNHVGCSGVSIGAANKITIGSNVMIGANTVITDTNWHDIAPDSRHLKDNAPGVVHIGDNVFIGYGVIILKNVRIGANSVIGAGSVVTKDIPANVIAAGNPCVVLKQIVQ